MRIAHFIQRYPPALGGFDSFDEPRTVTHYEQGEPVASWTVVVGRGFRGAPRVGNLH